MERPWVSSTSYASALEVLIRERHDLKLTQRDVADRLGKARSFVSKVENRERRLDMVEFVAWARALGVEPTELMKQVSDALEGPLDF